MRKYERAYITEVGNMVLVHYRPTHEYLGGFDTVAPAVKFLKNIMGMTQVNLLKWMKDHNRRLPRKIDFDDTKSNPFKENDDWFEKAWKGQTERFFKKHGIKQVTEELDFSLIQEVMGNHAERRKVPHKVEPVVEEEPEEIDLDLSFLEGILHSRKNAGNNVHKKSQDTKKRRKVVKK